MAKPATKTPAVPVAFDDIRNSVKRVSVLAEDSAQKQCAGPQ